MYISSQFCAALVIKTDHRCQSNNKVMDCLERQIMLGSLREFLNLSHQWHEVLTMVWVCGEGVYGEVSGPFHLAISAWA